MGHRAQIDALHEAESYRLRCGASPRRRATWHLAGHSLESRSGLWSVAGQWDMWDTSPPAEAAAPSAHTGCARSRVSPWFARHASGADNERDRPLFLVTDDTDSKPSAFYTSSPGLSVFAEVIVHLSHLKSRSSLAPLSPTLASVVTCCAYNSVRICSY